MKRSYMNLLVLVVNLACFATAWGQKGPQWLWAKTAGGFAQDYPLDMCTDKDGNVYVTGYFKSPSASFGSSSVSNAGGEDPFLVKYDINGNVKWVKSIIGSDNDRGWAVCTDPLGNIYLTGSLYSDSIDLGGTKLKKKGMESDIFIAKYDPDGNVAWAQCFGGNDIEEVYDVCTDKDGNIYLTGDFMSTSLDFGVGSLIHNSGYDLLLVKFKPDGTPLFAKTVPDDDEVRFVSVCADGLGNVYLAGQYSAGVTFGSDVFTNAGSSDLFLAKFDKNGQSVWARTARGNDVENCGGVYADSMGNVYVTCSFFSDSLFMGALEIVNKSGGLPDICVAKYNPTGSLVWGWSVGGTSFDVSLGISGSPGGGELAVTGVYNSLDLRLGGDLVDNGGSWDMFVFVTDSSGKMKWNRVAGGPYSEGAQEVCIDNQGHVLVCGSYSSTTLVMDGTTLINKDDKYDDIFVAKLDNHSTGLNDPAAKPEISIFPNPASDRFFIATPPGNFSVRLFDIHGECLLQCNVTERIQEMTLKGLAPGIYMCQVFEDNMPVQTQIVCIR